MRLGIGRLRKSKEEATELVEVAEVIIERLKEIEGSRNFLPNAL